MEGLRDIKDVVEIHDYSLAILIALIAALLFIAVTVAYLFKNRRRRKRPLSKIERARELLKNLDFSDTKAVVYAFTQEGAYFVDENNRQEYEAIESELLPYKYQKEIPPLDTSIEKRIKTFIGGIR